MAACSPSPRTPHSRERRHCRLVRACLPTPDAPASGFFVRKGVGCREWGVAQTDGTRHRKKPPRLARRYLPSQVRRVAVSIPANIAEGKGRGSNAEPVRFSRIALGSAYEIGHTLRNSVGVRTSEWPANPGPASAPHTPGAPAFIVYPIQTNSPIPTSYNPHAISHNPPATLVREKLPP